MRLESRPVEAELSAIRIALDLAGETGCALHIVHVTCAEGIHLVSEAKARGIDVTVETGPHYLLIDDEAAVRIGPAAKCAPPICSRAEVEALWREWSAGHVGLHSPVSVAATYLHGRPVTSASRGIFLAPLRHP